MSEKHKKNPLQTFLDTERLKYYQKACIMAVSQGHHHQIFISGEATQDLRYRIGGQSITIMTTVVLILEHLGKLKLDEPIHQYLPRVPNSQKITLRQLCNETAGLPDYVDDPKFVDAINQNEFRTWSIEELLEIIYKLKPLYEPGTQWNFGHLTNTVIIGRILEIVTEKPFAKVIEKYFIKPLKLKNTAVEPTQIIQGPVLRSFSDERLKPQQYEESTNWDPTWGGYATGTTSNPSDMIIISRALGTGSLLTHHDFKQLVAPTTVGLPPNTPQRYYALGLVVGGFGLDSLRSRKYPYTILWSDALFNGNSGVYSYIPSHDLVVHIQTNTITQLSPGTTATKILEDLFNTFTVEQIVTFLKKNCVKE